MRDKTSQLKLSFSALGLSDEVLKAVTDAGYETPTPIQAAAIPVMLSGVDLLAQAQTGTGKTAAFALPLLTRIALGHKNPRILVLTPTRELAIQVAEAFQSYARHLKHFRVLPVYGGQDYSIQLKSLKRGLDVVVGTPGRVMDHMRRGTLNLSELECLVLDEADEMLRMGFVDDVEWVLTQTPATRQIVLFSATLPPRIRQIANKYLKDPQQIQIGPHSTTSETTEQRYLIIEEHRKLDALTRLLEVGTYEGILCFVRRISDTTELAEKLNARGFRAAAINGALPQKQREKLISDLKQGKIDILVATDVAARGLDVERISHVLNYDIPYDPDSYIHRIGRTGRAGRSGKAVLFVTPRESRMLRSIEQSTKQRIKEMKLPSTKAVNLKRIAVFKEKLSEGAKSSGLAQFRRMIEEYIAEHDASALEVAAVLAKMLHGEAPLFLPEYEERALTLAPERQRRKERGPSNRSSSSKDHRRRGQTIEKKKTPAQERRAAKRAARTDKR